MNERFIYILFFSKFSPIFLVIVCEKVAEYPESQGLHVPGPTETSKTSTNENITVHYRFTSVTQRNRMADRTVNMTPERFQSQWL